MNVIFDLGGVLVDWEPWNLFRTVFATREDFDAFVIDSDFYAFLDRSDRGETIADKIDQLRRDAPHCVDAMVAFANRFAETCDVKPAAVALLQDLKSMGVNIFGISNWSAETFPQLIKGFPSLRLIRDVIVSGEVGLVKPEPEIYKFALQKWQIPASTCFFIDDKLENVRAAERLGMYGYHFDNLSDLRVALTKYFPALGKRTVEYE